MPNSLCPVRDTPLGTPPVRNPPTRPAHTGGAAGVTPGAAGKVRPEPAQANNCRPTCTPSVTAPSPASAEAVTFATARNRQPRSYSRSVSYENVE